MKKYMALMLSLSFLFSFISCKEAFVFESTNESTETKRETAILQPTEATTDTNATTYPPATVPTFTTETEIKEEPFVYEDTFESFMLFPSGKGYFFGKVAFERYETEGIPFVFFRVIGMEDEYVGEFMVYLVQIVDMYGVENYDTEKVYRMAWRGHLEDQLYGRPPLEIGKVYGRFLGLEHEGLQKLNLWQAGLIYDVKEENGKR